MFYILTARRPYRETKTELCLARTRTKMNRLLPLRQWRRWGGPMPIAIYLDEQGTLPFKLSDTNFFKVTVMVIVNNNKSSYYEKLTYVCDTVIEIFDIFLI